MLGCDIVGLCIIKGVSEPHTLFDLRNLPIAKYVYGRYGDCPPVQKSYWLDCWPMAQSGYANPIDACPLLGVERTQVRHCVMSAFYLDCFDR
jgi:hypothetical protein